VFPKREKALFCKGEKRLVPWVVYQLDFDRVLTEGMNALCELREVLAWLWAEKADF